MKTNPVHEWLARVAAECGRPGAMLEAAAHVINENTRRLMVEYANNWERQRRLEADVQKSKGLA